VELRVNAGATASLLRSTDLQVWAPFSLTLAADQAGVLSGFARWVAQDPYPPLDKKFYKLKVTR
jgi:hypothetical protein